MSSRDGARSRGKSRVKTASSVATSANATYAQAKLSVAASAGCQGSCRSCRRRHLAIRDGTGRWRGLEAQRLMPELCFPVAGADFLRRHSGRDPAELLPTSRIISNALHPDEWTEWCGAHGLQPPRTSNMIVLSSAELVVPAVLGGVGIGIGRRPTSIR
jgi:DNA-binding transcriptional LysR family regulator